MSQSPTVSPTVLSSLFFENGIFTEAISEEQFDDDLLESGHMDSMSLMMLIETIQQEYGLEIEPAIFIAELRNLNQLSQFIADQGGVS